MPRQCLMVETADQRKFFTHKKNLPMLVEFSKTFGADVSVVKIQDDTQVLDLVKLAPAICDANFKPRTDYEVLEKKICHKTKTSSKNNTRKIASVIKEYVEKVFLSGKVVELRAVATKFKKYGLTLACFCNHISQVRVKLQKEGYEINKIGGGKYQLST